jgi:hypothetical protein
MIKATQALEIAVNINKCKYDIMSAYYKTYCGDNVMVFISVSSILNDFTDILCNTNEFDPNDVFDENWLTAALLSIAVHYKNYFNKLPGVSNVKIYFYQGTEETYRIPITFESCVNNMRQYLLSTIVRFIPDIYYINIPGISSALIPYDLIWRCTINHMQFKTYTMTSALIVSSHISDYAPLHFAGMRREINVLVFRRKHPMLFGTWGIINDYLFKTRKTFNGDHLYNFNLLLALYIMCNPKKAMVSHLIPKNIVVLARTYLTKLLREYNHTSDYNTVLARLFGQKEFAPYRNIVDIEYSLMTNLLKIQSHFTIWSVDQIDFTIEDTNNSIFRHCPVDFKSLFA